MQGYGQATEAGQVRLNCDENGCSYSGWKSDGKWYVSFGVKACFGVCYTLSSGPHAI